MARPIDASAAATVNTNIVKIWPTMSFKKTENATKFIFTAAKINSRDISIIMTFFLFKKIPNTPITNSIADTER
jgi:branched-subunit amino acid transport protein AzlD